MRIAQALAVKIRQLQAEMGVRNTQIVVTGDISQWGSQRQLDAATTFLRGVHFIDKSPRNAQGVRGGSKILVLPGNHDVWGGVPPGSASQAFYQGYFPDAYPISTEGQAGTRLVVIVGLNSTFPARLNLAYGYVDPPQMHALGRIATAAKARSGKPILIAAMHHGVVLGHIWNQLLTRLVNYRAVLDSLFDNDFSLVLCGHEHMPALHPLQRGGKHLLVSVCGSTTAISGNPKSNAFRVYDIQEAEAEILTFEFDATLQSFESDSAQYRRVAL
jgi:3',5'-cyclic AMP phosphodiesterase CpdA